MNTDTQNQDGGGGPLTESIHPSFDADGYPTGETELAIANWDFRAAPGWLAYIKASWNHHYGRMWRRGPLLKMATGEAVFTWKTDHR